MIDSLFFRSAKPYKIGVVFWASVLKKGKKWISRRKTVRVEFGDNKKS